jgi:hypothetical protein
MSGHNHSHDAHGHDHDAHTHDHDNCGHSHDAHGHDHDNCGHSHETHGHDHVAHNHNHETHDHCGHDHDGHVHTHDIYTEDGIEPTVVSLTHEIPADAFPADELTRRAQRIVYTLTSVFMTQDVLIGHIKLQLLDTEGGGLFVSATSPQNITVAASGGFTTEQADAAGNFEFGLTVIVFGMAERHAASLAEGIVDGILCCPV